jgi:hypothetical protein
LSFSAKKEKSTDNKKEKTKTDFLSFVLSQWQSSSAAAALHHLFCPISIKAEFKICVCRE